MKLIVKLQNSIKEIINESNDGGDCFQVAGNYILSTHESILVHGMVHGQGALQGYKFAHAWIEDAGYVIDNANGNHIKIPRSVYYALGHIDERDCIYYRYESAIKFILKTKHWGPWERIQHFKTTKLSEAVPVIRADVGRQGIKVSSDIFAKLTAL